MKKLLTILAVLVLSVVFYSQDKAYATDLTLEDEAGSQLDIIQIQEKLSVVKPVEIDTNDYLVQSSVTSDNIYIIDTEGKKVSSRVVLLDDRSTVMVVPTKPLKYATQYGVIMTTNVKSTSGVNRAEKIYRFTTVAKPQDAKQDVTKVKKPTLTNSQLDYFLSAAFSSKQPQIIKWNTGLKVALIGSPTAADKNEVNKVLKEITALTGLSVKVTTAKNANIKMYFGKPSYGEKHMNMGTIPTNTPGGYHIKPTQKSYIGSANIYVNSTYGVTARKHVIRKTLTISLGFPNQTYGSTNSIFYIYGKGTSYSNLDKKIIKALYSPYTPVGTTKEQLREMYRK